MIEIYYDRNFNCIGKKIGITPWGSNEDGILYSVTQNNNKIVLKIIDSLKIEKFSEVEYKKQLDSLYSEYYNRYCMVKNASNLDNLAKMVNNLSKKILQKDYNLLVISGNGCFSCNEDVFYWIKINESFLNKQKQRLYILLLDTNNIFYINLNKVNNIANFIIDQNSENKIYFHDINNINPLLVSVKNKEIKKIYYYDKNKNRFFKKIME